MTLRILANFLDKHQIGYTTIKHPDTITEKGLEGVSHIVGNGFAKVMMAKADGKYVMMVIPSMHTLDLSFLRNFLGVRDIELVNAKDSKELFPGCENDAIPPFGNLVGIPVYIDKDLTEDDGIAFNAGNHLEVIMMSYREFERLVQPVVVSFQNVG